MKKTKTQKGITLIALIITIVVLLIIAVVAVSVVKESNIIGHAEKAAKDYNSAKDDEQGKISGYEDFMQKYANGGSETGNSGNNGENTPPQQTAMPVATVGIIASENSTINGEMYSSTNPIIPAGFKAINVAIAGNESNWDAANGPEVDKGLVIQDESGNEFVWVPVDYDISTVEYVYNSYKEPATIGEIETDSYGNPTDYYYDAAEENLRLANCEDIDLDGTLEVSDFESELKNSYKSMAESINKYDGFYVGRYETSMNGTNPQSKASTEEKTIVSATAAIDSANTWYGLYALNKKYSASSVQTSMMWGIQYDKMMSWMGDLVNTDIGENRNKDRTCGTAPDDVINNVYDLYGNSYEWTLETYRDKCRSYRGRLLFFSYCA